MTYPYHKESWLYDDVGFWRTRYVVAAVAAGVVAIVLALGVGSNIVSSGQCATYQQRYGLRTHWTMFYGCFMRLPDGHWVTSGNYQAFQQVVR